MTDQSNVSVHNHCNDVVAIFIGNWVCGHNFGHLSLLECADAG